MFLSHRAEGSPVIFVFNSAMILRLVDEDLQQCHGRLKSPAFTEARDVPGCGEATLQGHSSPSQLLLEPPLRRHQRSDGFLAEPVAG